MQLKDELIIEEEDSKLKEIVVATALAYGGYRLARGLVNLPFRVSIKRRKRTHR